MSLTETLPSVLEATHDESVEIPSTKLGFEFAGLEGEASAVSRGLCSPSPDGQYIACINKTHLRVLEAATLRVAASRSCDKDANMVLWSPVGHLVAVCSTVSKAVQVFSVDDPKWNATFNEGMGGLLHAMWAPNGRWLVTISDFGLYATAYDVLDGRTVTIEGPKVISTIKPNSFPSMAFSHDGILLAYLSRKDSKDYVNLYETSGFTQLRRFQLDTIDAAAVSWSPDNTCMSIADDPLHYKLLICKTDGSTVMNYQAYEHALGISTVQWSTANCTAVTNTAVEGGGDGSESVVNLSRPPFLAVGSFDATVRVIDGFTMTVIGEKTAIASVDGAAVDLYVEVETDDGVDSSVMECDDITKPLREASNTTAVPKHTSIKPRAFTNTKALNASVVSHKTAPTTTALNTTTTTATGSVMDKQTKFRMESGKFTLTSLSPTATIAKDSVLPVTGVNAMKWSYDGRLIAVKYGQYPSTLHIIDRTTMTFITILHFIHPIADFAWSPAVNRVAVCCGSAKLFMWDSEGCSIVTVPGGGVKSVTWVGSEGTCVLTQSKSSFKVGYMFATA